MKLGVSGKNFSTNESMVSGFEDQGTEAWVDDMSATSTMK